MKRLKRFIVLILATVVFLVSSSRSAFAEEGGNPRFFLLNADHLALAKRLWKAGNWEITFNVNEMILHAKSALKRGPYTVTDKKYLPPSGDKHDFCAIMGYSWPNPDTEDGMPWIIRDGYLNPDVKMDWARIKPMSQEIGVLALAYYFTEKEMYAKHAALLLRTFFINETTRMNPNVNYGKIIPGVSKGGYQVAGFGYMFRQIYDAAGILESSPSWTGADKKALQHWTRQFMKWVETSPHGKKERKRDNNHGTFYDMTTTIQAMYLGDDAKARATLQSYIDNRFSKQFKPDGTQPFAMKRANNYDYHRCNLMIALDIAQLGDHFEEIDLWNYKTNEGASLHKSMKFLIPYFIQQKKWPYFSGDKFKIKGFPRWRLLRRAAVGFGDTLFAKAAEAIPGDNDIFLINLTYPRAAVPFNPGVVNTNAESVKKANQPRLFLLNADHLTLTKKLWYMGDQQIHASMKRLVRHAKSVLKCRPYTITKKKYLPPSGDKRDFFSIMGYSWPNPDTEDGMPWIVRDGYHNPDTKTDWKTIWTMSKNVEVLALAYYFTGKETYAKHAALLLRTFFINETTRMNPNANYGKIIPGVTKGGYPVAGFGYAFRKICDAAGILESSSSWADADKKALQQWIRQFMEWVETSPYGEKERKRDNNHGTFYDMITALQAMYLGDNAKARVALQSYIDNRVAKQFKPDGTQPFAMKRANNYDYHRCNLMIAIDIAQLADHFEDIDLWNYKTAEGASLHKSMKFLIPYFTRKKKWPYFTGGQFKIPAYARLRLLRRAAVGFTDSSFEKAAREIKGYNYQYLLNLTHPRRAVVQRHLEIK